MLSRVLSRLSTVEAIGPFLRAPKSCLVRFSDADADADADAEDRDRPLQHPTHLRESGRPTEPAQMGSTRAHGNDPSVVNEDSPAPVTYGTLD